MYFNKQIYNECVLFIILCFHYSIRSPLSFKSSSSLVRGDEIDEDIVDEAGD
jgi:hypothetical protein